MRGERPVDHRAGRGAIKQSRLIFCRASCSQQHQSRSSGSCDPWTLLYRVGFSICRSRALLALPACVSVTLRGPPIRYPADGTRRSAFGGSIERALTFAFEYAHCRYTFRQIDSFVRTSSGTNRGRTFHWDGDSGDTLLASRLMIGGGIVMASSEERARGRGRWLTSRVISKNKGPGREKESRNGRRGRT